MHPAYKKETAEEWYDSLHTNTPFPLRLTRSEQDAKSGAFRNPWPTFQQRNFLDVLKWKLGWCCEPRSSSGAPKFPSPQEAKKLLPSVDAIDSATIRRYEKVTSVAKSPLGPGTYLNDPITATWCGHASFLVQHGGVTILTDPVWSERCSPVQFMGPKRMVAPPMPLSHLPRVHIVTISHNHYDHLDTQSVKDLIRFHRHPIFVVPRCMKSRWFASLPPETGIQLSRVIELDWWERGSLLAHDLLLDDYPPGVKVRVTAVPVQHWSMRTMMDRFMELWCGFVVDIFTENTTENADSKTLVFKRIFHSGDTGMCPVFKEIGEALGPIDLALFPIGA